jgi:hypothetical protein
VVGWSAGCVCESVGSLENTTKSFVRSRDIIERGVLPYTYIYILYIIMIQEPNKTSPRALFPYE